MPVSLSTLAGQVGGCTLALMPLFNRLEVHVLAADRLHGVDTTVPVLAKGKTSTGRIWGYVRDDKPFGGQAPPGAVFYYSRDRAGEHPQPHLASYSGIFQADAYGGYGRLYEAGRNVGPILEAACWVHRQRRRQGDGLHAQALSAFTRFLDDGRICLSNNRQRALRGIARSVGSPRCSAAPTAAATAPR